MINLKVLISTLAVAASLAACGGGGGGDSVGAPNPEVPAGGGPPSGGGSTPTGGSVATGSISAIVGSYSVKVVKFDCDPVNQPPNLTVAPQANGSCKITNPLFTEIRRNMLPAGTYTLKITADGAIEMLQGTASKLKISCPPSPGVCRVDGSGAPGYTYSISSGSVGSTPTSLQSALSSISFNVVNGKTSIFGGLLATFNTNVTYTGVNPLQSGETGILDIQPN